MQPPYEINDRNYWSKLDELLAKGIQSNEIQWNNLQIKM